MRDKGVGYVPEELFPFGIGKVGPPVEWLLVGHQKHVEWPPPLEPHGLHGVHVDIVQVGAFFAIDFDANVVAIHQLSCRFIFKAFTFHHMAPVAGRVTDRH